MELTFFSSKPTYIPTMADKVQDTGKDATNVAGRENKGMGMADKLAGAVKDPVNQALGGDNTKSKGEQSSLGKADQTPGKNY